MLNVTETASRKLGEIIAQQTEPVFGLRVSVQDGGCSCHQFALSLSPASVEGDWIGEFGGIRVLVDPESAPQLQGVQIDWVESLQGSGFTVTNPHARRGCGCGHALGGESEAPDSQHAGSGGSGESV
jgi:iron-sulfur cluster assembly protein